MPDEVRSSDLETNRLSTVPHSASRAIFGSLVSLITGLASQVIVAWLFGAGAGMDAFLTALIIPTYLWVVLVGGLAFVFVPMFVNEETVGSTDTAWSMVGTFFWLTAILLIIVATVGAAFASQIIAIMAPGMNPDKAELAAHMLSILIFTVPLLGLGTLMESVQNARGSFFWPATARALGSLGNVATLLLLHRSLGPMALAWSNFVSVLLAASVPAIPVLRHGWNRLIPLTDRRVKDMLILLAPLMVFGLVNNSNLLFERYFASMLSDGSLAYLGYAYKISNMLVAVLAAGIASAILPAMAKAYSEGGEKALTREYQHALRLTLATSLPAVALLSTAATPLVMLLFERGAFDHQATESVSRIVLAILLGDVVFRMLGNVIGRTFYVLKNTYTYPLVSALSIGVYIVVGKILVDAWGYVGLAIALPIQAGTCVLVAFILISRRLRFSLSVKLLRDILLYIVASLLAALAVWVVRTLFPSFPVFVVLVTVLGTAGLLYMALLIWLDRAMAVSVMEISGLVQIGRWLLTGPLAITRYTP